jgi:hypothetical protein
MTKRVEPIVYAVAQLAGAKAAGIICRPSAGVPSSVNREAAPGNRVPMRENDGGGYRRTLTRPLPALSALAAR